MFKLSTRFMDAPPNLNDHYIVLKFKELNFFLKSDIWLYLEYDFQLKKSLKVYFEFSRNFLLRQFSSFNLVLKIG